MLALELFKSKLEQLKSEIENDQWYPQNVSVYLKNVIKRRTMNAKTIVLLLILNPILITPALFILDLRPDWAIYPAEEPIRHAIMTTFYILFMLGSCGVVYANLLVYMYFSICIKIAMEVLTEYFQGTLTKLCTKQDNEDLEDIHDLLIVGIKRHAKLVRYARCNLSTKSTKCVTPAKIYFYGDTSKSMQNFMKKS